MNNQEYTYKEVQIHSTISTETLLKQFGDLILISLDDNHKS